MQATDETQPRLYQVVATQITRLIEEGAYQPGSRLPGERTLAERFKVSRVTVHAALVSLQTLGLVEIRSGSGVYVCEQESHMDSVLTTVSTFELTQARMLFESEAAALAAQDISKATLQKLKSLLEDMQGDVPEEEANIADRDFHLTIARASNNRVVVQVVEWLWKLRMENESIRNDYHEVCSTDLLKRGEEHYEVLESLQAHDVEGSRLAMRRHFRRLIDSMILVSEERELEEVKRRAAKSRQRFLTDAV